MKSKLWILIVGLTLAISASQAAQAQELVIDNFISSQSTRKELVDGRTIIRRSGDPANIVGGVRETDFGVTPVVGGGFGRSTVLDIPRIGPMFLESGVKSAFGLIHFYGNDKHGNLNPLNLAFLL